MPTLLNCLATKSEMYFWKQNGNIRQSIINPIKRNTNVPLVCVQHQHYWVPQLEFWELEMSWSVLIKMERDWPKLRPSEPLQDRNNNDNLAQSVSVSLGMTAQPSSVTLANISSIWWCLHTWQVRFILVIMRCPYYTDLLYWHSHRLKG